MASDINVAIPPLGNPTTSGVRNNFSAAKSEIEELQTSRCIRLQHVSESVEVFQQCAVSDTQQIIQFNQELFNNGGVFMYDNLLHEVTIMEPGYYCVLVNFQVVRKLTGTLADFIIHAELKPPAGSFTDFPGSARIMSISGAEANYKNWRAYTVMTRIPEAGYKVRWLQSTNDASKQIGIVSYPPSGGGPSAAGIVFTAFKVGEEL